MKSRYLFNATGGSVLVTPYDYVMEARPGSLRLIEPSGAIHAIHFVIIIVVVFGYLGLFILIGSSSAYQAARPWENPALLWTFLGLFFVGFFVLLFATEKWAQRLAVRGAVRLSTRADHVTLRGFRAGALIQRVLLQTLDSRTLAVEVEAPGGRFREALKLANVTLPPVPLSEEEFLSTEFARQAAVEAAPAPMGPGRINFPGLMLVVLFGGGFNLLYIWLLTIGSIVIGLLGLAIFGPLTAYMAYTVSRSRRLQCTVCNRLTAFRRSRERWTCARCGTSWPQLSVKPNENGGAGS